MENFGTSSPLARGRSFQICNLLILTAGVKHFHSKPDAADPYAKHRG